MEPAPRLLWRAFAGAANAVPVVVGVASAWVGSYYTPSHSVGLSLFWLVGAATLTVVICVTAIRFGLLARREAAATMGRVRHVATTPVRRQSGETEVTLLVLDPNPNLSSGALATVFYEQTVPGEPASTYERLIGLGYIQTINRRGNPQFVLIEESAAAADIWTRLKENDRGVSDQIVIRPSVPYDWLRERGLAE